MDTQPVSESSAKQTLCWMLAVLAAEGAALALVIPLVVWVEEDDLIQGAYIYFAVITIAILFPVLGSWFLAGARKINPAVLFFFWGLMIFLGYNFCARELKTLRYAPLRHSQVEPLSVSVPGVDEDEVSCSIAWDRAKGGSNYIVRISDDDGKFAVRLRLFLNTYLQDMEPLTDAIGSGRVSKRRSLQFGRRAPSEEKAAEDAPSRVPTGSPEDEGERP